MPRNKSDFRKPFFSFKPKRFVIMADLLLSKDDVLSGNDFNPDDEVSLLSFLSWKFNQRLDYLLKVDNFDKKYNDKLNL